MDSTDFDTYLYLIDPAGNVVAESGGNLLVGSQIVYTTVDEVDLFADRVKTAIKTGVA